MRQSRPAATLLPVLAGVLCLSDVAVPMPRRGQVRACTIVADATAFTQERIVDLVTVTFTAADMPDGRRHHIRGELVVRP